MILNWLIPEHIKLKKTIIFKFLPSSLTEDLYMASPDKIIMIIPKTKPKILKSTIVETALSP